MFKIPKIPISISSYDYCLLNWSLLLDKQELDCLCIMTDIFLFNYLITNWHSKHIGVNMNDPKQEIKRRIQNLSDDELLEAIEVKSDEYTDEALSIAKGVAEERGGIKKLKQDIEKAQQESKESPIEEPTIEDFEDDLTEVDKSIENDDKESKQKKQQKKIENKIVIKKRNKVERVILSGGIIGMLGTSPRRALANKIKKANAEGWTVRQVLDDNTGNLLVFILRVALLFLTLFIWTPSNGYFIILEKEEI